MNVLFLPGVGGDPAFWRPVADRLPAAWPKKRLAWPGLGAQPPAPDVNGWDDLYRLVERKIAERDNVAENAGLAGGADVAGTAIVAQSMGGVLAIRAALEHRHAVSHVVLTATSGGIDLSPFGVADWRADYRNSFPQAPAWAYEHHTAREADLRTLVTPTLLIWAARDPLSPAAVGRHLADLLPNARLVVLDEENHMFARDRADEIAPLIEEHITPARSRSREAGCRCR